MDQKQLEDRFEGVIPKQAVCAHCGYQFGGARITGGSIRCSECGKDTDFVAPLRPGNRRRPSARWRVVRRVGSLIIVVLIVIMALSWIR